MDETVVGIILLLVGCAMILWRDRFARKTIEEQNRVWGFRFGEREEKRTKLIVFVVGMGFIVFGLLALSGVWQFRS